MSKKEPTIYTVAEFRKNMKEALDKAIQGEEVYIERLGQLFRVEKHHAD